MGKGEGGSLCRAKRPASSLFINGAFSEKKLEAHTLAAAIFPMGPISIDIDTAAGLGKKIRRPCNQM